MLIKLITTFFIPLLTQYFFYFIFNKKKILVYDDFKQSHKNKYEKPPILIGGPLYITILIIYVLLNGIINLEYTSFVLYLLTVFFVGYLSDTNLKNNPLQRLLLLILINSIFIFFSKYQLNFIDIKFLTSNNFVMFILSLLCILTLKNGFNFIDGTNCNISFYFIVILLFLLNQSNLNFTGLICNKNFMILFISAGIVFSIFNALNLTFHGDNGAYVLGAIIGYLFIEFYNLNFNKITSIYVANLLFYPVFETIFSMLKRFITKKNPTKADGLHLHHFVNAYSKRISQKHYSLITSILINGFFVLSFLLASLDILNQIYQLKVFILNSVFYTVVYFFIRNRVSGVF